MSGLLRTEAEIRAAGAEAVADFPPLRDDQVDRIVALLSPVARDVQAGKDDDTATDAA